MKFTSIQTDNRNTSILCSKHFLFKTGIIRTTVRQCIHIFISVEADPLLVTAEGKILQQHMIFFFVQKFIFSGLCIVKTQLGAGNISHIFSVRRLGDSSYLYPQWVICQLYHFPAVQIHFKQIAYFCTLVFSVGQKIYGFSI